MKNTTWLTPFRSVLLFVIGGGAGVGWWWCVFQILQVSVAVGEWYQIFERKEAAHTREKKLSGETGNIMDNEGKWKEASSREEVQEQKVDIEGE